MAKPKGTLAYMVGGKSGSDHGGVRIESCDGSFCFLSSLAGSKFAYTNVTVTLVFYY